MYGILTHCDPNPFTAGKITCMCSEVSERPRDAVLL